MSTTRAEVRAWLAERLEESNHWISELFLRANRFDSGADDRRYWHREAALARAALAALDDAERMDWLEHELLHDGLALNREEGVVTVDRYGISLTGETLRAVVDRAREGER